MLNNDLETKELNDVFQLFFDKLPIHFEIQNTSRGNDDFREMILSEWKSGEKYVIKLSDNNFTFAEKIEAWKRCAEEYRKLGYYCPAILYSKKGDFPTITYKGHKCVAYAEEFSKYNIAANRSQENIKLDKKCLEDVCIMTAKVAAQKFDFTNYPSGYCLFDTFCPSDETDEVLENALNWKMYADTLPCIFQPQVQRIWQRWIENRKMLEQIYYDLPTSVFQADLNPTNILLDDNGEFVGIFDFNLCGKDVLLNYFMREFHWLVDENCLLEILKKMSHIYAFSNIEKKAASLLYRCLKPLWYTEIKKLKEAGNDQSLIQICLDTTEELQTKDINFEYYMNQ